MLSRSASTTIEPTTPSSEPTAHDPPRGQPWTRRWWRVPGETLLNGTPIAGKNVSATLKWCHRDEWGIEATHAEGKSSLIFNVEISSHDRDPVFVHNDKAPPYVVKILGDQLMRRLGRGIRQAAEHPIVIELVKQFATTSWVSGARLRQATKLSLEEFAAHMERLTPRFMRKEFSFDPSSERYGLTLPAVLELSASHAERIQQLFQAVAHRFAADADAETYGKSDLIAVGWKEPDLDLAARLGEIALLVGRKGDGQALPMPSDREAIAEAVKNRVSFDQYLLDAAAAGTEGPEHYPVRRPWLTAPLWLERDGSQTDYVPGPMLWQTPWDGQAEGVDSSGESRLDEETASSRFEIGKSLGEGRFAEVFRARDTLLKRDVAIKLVRRGGAISVTALEHARALARVVHANIVSVFDIETVRHPADGQLVDAVVMELVDGIELTERLGSPLDRTEALRIAAAMIDGIGAYHAHGRAS